MHEARHHHQQQQQQQLYSQHGQLPMASSSASQQHLQQQQQQQQQHAHQLRPAHHQPPPLTHGLTPSGGGGSSRHNSNNNTLQGSGGTLGRGASPPHGSAPPHLPISGSSVSYSDDNGSFNMLSLPFDDSSSHLDLPSLLQANGNRDSRYNVGDHHHGYSAHAPLQPQHHRHTPQAASAWSHPEPLPPVRLGTESKPQEPLQPSPEPSPDQLRDTGPPPPQQITPPTKKRNADTFAQQQQQQQQQQHQGQFTIDDAPKPTRTKKKKTVEKASVPLDDSDVLDDEFGDECDGADGVPKDVKRQMRLVKNRQAAQQFRKRQKQYIQDLERRCSNLTAQNAAFGAKVELLTTENRLVKEQLEYLRSFVSQAVQVSLTPAAVSGGPLQMPGPLSAALAGAIPAPLLGIGSPLAGALSSSLPSQTGPGRPAFAALQPTGSSAGSTKMPSFSSPISLAPSSAQQQQQQQHQQHLQQQQQQQRLPYLSASSGHHHQPLHAMSSAGYSRGGPSSLMPELAPRPL